MCTHTLRSASTLLNTFWTLLRVCVRAWVDFVRVCALVLASVKTVWEGRLTPKKTRAVWVTLRSIIFVSSFTFFPLLFLSSASLAHILHYD